MKVNIDHKYIKLSVIIIFVAIFFYLIVHFDIFHRDSIVKLLALKSQNFSFESFYVLATTILLIFFVPISWLSFAAAYFFGLKGALLITAAGLLSSTASFGIARIFKNDVSGFIERLYNRKVRNLSLEELYSKIKSYGFGYVVFIRSMPFIPFSIFNYIFGISIISFKYFFMATLLSVSIGQSINVYFFHKALKIGEGPLDTLIAAAIKGVYFLLIILWQRKSKYNAKE